MPPRLFSRAKTSAALSPFESGALGRLGLGLLLACSLGLAAISALAQAKETTPPHAPASTPVGKSTLSKPLWRELSARQQRALQPLAPLWDGLSAPHKRRWLAISRNYARLSTEDQEILHSRMTEWAALTNQQRIQARFNFAEVKQLPTEERKAKWEAYQALSEKEKEKLAARATPRAPGAAVTIRPVPIQKLAPIPAIAPDGQRTPRIQLAPPVPVPPPTRLRATNATAPPVPAELQVPDPSSVPSGEVPASPKVPPVRVTEQPSSAS
ncbi:hypothetical protein E5CHR_02852 [Variovorax sp. PBL-E5]|nr:hypothetical protein E5CHR_02852 [Variovorax sp. PBL-E5]